MRTAVGVICIAALVLLLAEFFSVFLLPRRVKRDPRIVRGLIRTLWIPWRAVGTRLPKRAADTMLGIYGPLGLLAILAIMGIGVMVCFAGLQWAISADVGLSHVAPWGRDLYFSASTFFSVSTTAQPSGVPSEVLQVAEAASGYGVLFIAIGYLPALFQAFSRRETAVSRLDPRAGSPPSAGALLERSGERGGWEELDEYLREWETWTAELMETHLSYPILGYFRSQHVNQNWLAALTTIVDACAYAIAYGPDEAIEASELTFRVGRHALADLAHAFSPRRARGRPEGVRERLNDETLAELRRRLEGSGLHVDEVEESRERLQKLRSSYEPYAVVIADQLALQLPDWLPSDEVRENWRQAVSPRSGQHQH